MKKQIIVIHGGDTFDTYEDYLHWLRGFEIDFERFRGNTGDWKKSLTDKLGPKFEVIQPNMPNKTNAKYLEWKIWFEKFILYFDDEIVLVGHSLGGTFLMKYLAENILPKKICGLFSIAAVYDDTDNLEPGQTMADFILPDSFEKLQQQTNKIFLYHSEDDPVVTFADLAKFQKALPGATSKIFKNRGHFNQEEFPEIVEDIKSIG